MDIIRGNFNWRAPLKPLSEVQKLIQHHAAHPTWGANEVHDYHRNSRRWAGIGYNYWITFDGDIIECRGLHVGAHSGPSWNGRSLGVCYQGYLHQDNTGNGQNMTDAQVEAGAWLNAKLIKEHGLKVADIIGHKDVSATACPGNNFRMKELHSAAEGLLNAENDKPKDQDEVLYRVQCGAFRSRANADNTETRLQVDGFDTYVVKADGLYKVQTGAFHKEENAKALADRLEKAGYETYITTRSGVHPGLAEDEPAPGIEVGSRVKVKRGARDYNGGSLASFVYDRTFNVIQIRGDRVVIGQGGAVTAAVNKQDLCLA